jgi:Fe-S-cluster-containing hydrogenase component 2/thioredoxin reductase/CRP-like cAMP-binding protein
MPDHYHIVIVGSGPAGLSAAARAAFYDQKNRVNSPSHLLLEAFDRPSKTIQQYQKGKFVMAEPSALNLRSDCRFSASSREQILANWTKEITDQKINVRYNTKVIAISGSKGNFKISLATGEDLSAEHIVLAIGLEGNPRPLGVPGEHDSIVQYTLDDPEAYQNEIIVVVGAGDSAIENALGLAKQNQVYIVNRREEFSRAKEGNLNAILKAINDPKVTLDCFYQTSLKELRAPISADDKHQLILKTPDGEKTIACDRIIARLGGVPPREFVEKCGIEFGSSAADASPTLNGHYESSVPGLYVVGSLAGYPLIKQAMNQGYDVVEYILGHDIKPADYPLLQLQFGLLPYRREADDILKLFQQRIPMFSQLNALAFRELILESNIWVALEKGPAYDDAKITAEKLQQRASQESSSSQVAPPRTAQLIKTGDPLYLAGEYTNTFYTIVEGEVAIEFPDNPSKRFTLQRGEFFGESSLISGRPRDANVYAGKDCILVETPRRTMLKLMNAKDTVKKGIDWIFIVRALQKHFAPTVDPKLLRPISELAELKTYQAGDILFTQGERGDCLYIIRRGSVSLSRRSKNEESHNEDIVVSQLQSDQFAGELALMGDEIRRETATANVLTETIVLYREGFLALLELDPSCIDSLQQLASHHAVSLTSMEAQYESGKLMGFLMDKGLGEATNAMVIDESLCIGCDNCETACAETHQGVSRLNRAEGATYNNIHIPIACRHCEHPYCMKDCPPDAIHRAATGEVFIDDKCIGCGNCEKNCPYDAIKLTYAAPPKPSFWNWLLFGSGPGLGEETDFAPTEAAKQAGKKAVKCDACVGSKQGPACVNACPTGAAVRLSPDNFIALIQRQ